MPNQTEIQFDVSTPVVRTWLNYKAHAMQYEENYEPSQTIPDQTMSMREILDRFAKGLPVGAGRVPIWDEEDDLPDVRTLDLADLQAHKEAYQAEIDSIRSNDAKRKAELSKRKKEAKNAELDAIYERMKSEFVEKQKSTNNS